MAQDTSQANVSPLKMLKGRGAVRRKRIGKTEGACWHKPLALLFRDIRNCLESTAIVSDLAPGAE
jgi:hypothetical protein